MANAYDRLTLVSVENVLPYIGKGEKREYAGQMVKMGSQRYQVFSKSLACASCELVGSFFALERDKSQAERDGSYHFNLYAYRPDGREVMMTKDHIVPKSKGGKDELSNYTTMCAPCNQKKAAKVPEVPKEVFVVRQFYQDCNDMSYIGAYDNFWNALAASIADSKKDFREPGHSFAVHEPDPHNDRELWCEILFNKRPQGIYYTIDRMELQ